jgi:hypothetical protein
MSGAAAPMQNAITPEAMNRRMPMAMDRSFNCQNSQAR